VRKAKHENHQNVERILHFSLLRSMLGSVLVFTTSFVIERVFGCLRITISCVIHLKIAMFSNIYTRKELNLLLKTLKTNYSLST